MGPDNKSKLVDQKCRSCDADISQDPQGHVCVSLKSESGAPDPMIGKLVHERYRILEPISAGGWAKVYVAEHLALGTKVAFKILNTDLAEQEDKRKRFEFEAQCASKIDHPNIGRIFDYGLFEGRRPFIVMELLSGATFAEYLSQKRVLRAEEFKQIFSQLIDGITAAHTASLVHRDLKPSNIMFANANFEDLKVKILDFGIAKSVDSSAESPPAHNLTSTGEILGTPAYMSPEQISGRRVDQRSDIYALACMMYESASGKRPFEALNVFEVMVKHCQEQPRSISSQLSLAKYPAKLDSFILRCLDKNPDDRFVDSKEMKEAFNQVWQGTYSGKYPRAKTSGPEKKNMLSLLLVLTVLPAVVFFSQNKFRKEAETVAARVSPNTSQAAKTPVSQEDEGPFVEGHTSKVKTLVSMNLELIKQKGGATNALSALKDVIARSKSAEQKSRVNCQIGSLYELCGQVADARKVYRNDVEDLTKKYGGNSAKLLAPFWRLRRSYAVSGDYAQAELFDQKRLKILEFNKISNPEEKAMFILNLVEDCLYLGKMEEAAAFLNSAELVIYAENGKVPKLQEAYSFALKAHQSFRIHQDKDASTLATKAYELAIAASQSDISAEVLEKTALIFQELRDRRMLRLSLRKAVHARRVVDDEASDEMISDCLQVAQTYPNASVDNGVVKFLKEFPNIAEMRPGPPKGDLLAGLLLYIRALKETGKSGVAKDIEKQLMVLKSRSTIQLPAVQ